MRRSRATFSLLLIAAAFSTLSFAVQPDRINAPLSNGQMISLKGHMHGLARPEFDQGRTDGNKVIHGLSLSFKPSPAQQASLDKLLAQQQDSSSPNYHRWLTPAQFGDRFGLSRNDINKVVSWLQSQGFTVTRIANNCNQIFFEGTVAQVEIAFHTQIHNYLVDGELHYANASEPSVPAALEGTVLAIQHLHSFSPRPRARVQRISADGVDAHFTSYVSGNHFISPADFATIYDVQGLYNAGTDGTGQKIAVVGQSSINVTDVAHFRSAAGLTVNNPTLLLEPGTGTSTRCAGDEGESDLDVEFSGGVAKNATVVFVYTGLVTGDSCSNRSFNVFDALQYAIDQQIAPVISISYGNCEANIGSAGATGLQQLAQQANAQQQTIISASGDSGAADCDFHVQSATQGLAVDIPGAIPEVTSAGGTEFSGDLAGVVTGTPPNTNAGATTYWAGTTNGTDPVNGSSALSYIPEMGWNDSAADIAAGGDISASGGGASTFFSKPSWQSGRGVPADGQRDVPDISVSSSADHDGYLFCSEDGPNGTIVATCVTGFRTSAGGNLTVVGGTSVAAPTLAGVVALINQFLGNTPPVGLGNINPTLYKVAQNSGAAFHDVTTGNNIVPCSSGPNCPTSGTKQFGFSAGAGYDQVTGLGSINATTLAQAWAASGFLLTSNVQTISVVQGQPGNASITVTPQNGFSSPLTFTCADTAPASTCTITPSGSTTTNPVTLQVTTSSPTGQLLPPLGGQSRIFYAAWLPGLLGLMLTAGSRKRAARSLRLLSLIVFLGFSTLWMGGCGGSTSSSMKTGGTTKGNYTLTVNATTGGSNPIVNSTMITLQVN
jgi:subtilase family serine protease